MKGKGLKRKIKKNKYVYMYSMYTEVKDFQDSTSISFRAFFHAIQLTFNPKILNTLTQRCINKSPFYFLCTEFYYLLLYGIPVVEDGLPVDPLHLGPQLTTPDCSQTQSQKRFVCSPCLPQRRPACSPCPAQRHSVCSLYPWSESYPALSH